MNDIIMWCIIGAVGAIALAILVVFIIKFCRLSKEEKKKLILVWIKGAVAQAEKEIGAGHGDEKFKEVEDYFHKRAPWFIKILLLATGKDSLKEIIELALKEIKESFEK